MDLGRRTGAARHEPRSRRGGGRYVVVEPAGVDLHHDYYTVRDGDGRSRRLVYIVRSRDGGKTFDEPIATYPNNLANISEMPVVLTDGTVVASFVDASAPAPENRDYAFERRRAWMKRSGRRRDHALAGLVRDRRVRPAPSIRAVRARRRRIGRTVPRPAVASRAASEPAGRWWSPRPRIAGDTWTPPVAVGPSSIDAVARRVPALAVNRNGVLGALVVERRAVSGD